MNYKINIGLEGDIYSQVITSLNNLRAHLIDDYHITEADGSYLGNPERTAVVSLSCDKGYKHVHNVVKKLANDLKQDCIPLQLNGAGGELIYSDNYKGERLLFDDKYFLSDHV